MRRNTLAIGCGILGGILGHLGFALLQRQGFYAIVLPGGLVGLAAGIVPTRSRLLVPIVCALLAAVAGLVTEYHFAPFADDDSFTFFLRHVSDLRTVPLILIAVGAVIGFWVPFRRRVG